MSKKDYEAVAAMLRKRVEATEGLAPVRRSAVRMELAAVAVDLADIFAADNERFDRVRFLKAAGVWAA